MTFESALSDCRRAASSGFLLADDPDARLERALAWADDLAREGLVPEAFLDRLHGELRAESAAGSL
ncbi:MULTISPECIES: hypothetical protein [unclassified Methylobacterium]|jgi:hypothetical protein|uniref:hypothetical protein n=1 Tax=unclassified Methylobacterium TaxID=2615210 RepID=UPI000CB87A0B|nr:MULTISPECIES: hypothetical protein [unclassified Methylobacterium]PIU05072.1 MAG: hypothetical protein COT56_16490 [Methylobacterium sp. CG09_land_8_20_14_0_10_71_15]PIU11862.1 MAG: hypothetical protein COT28_17845 [Methylobacterium sp. CG08_land_8_20_14_0_20_71_15]GBU19030.1 hypothetical protein AwMethylo_32450 [Methylobacterium sp.]